MISKEKAQELLTEAVSHNPGQWEKHSYLVAQCCLSHSFCVQEKGLEDYLGKHDITEEQKKELAKALQEVVYDDFDLLIQLSDSLAGGECIMNIEERMQDVKNRYGSFPQDKWNKNLEIKAYFEQKAGQNIYDIIGLEGNK